MDKGLGYDIIMTPLAMWDRIACTARWDGVWILVWESARISCISLSGPQLLSLPRLVPFSIIPYPWAAHSCCMTSYSVFKKTSQHTASQMRSPFKAEPILNWRDTWMVRCLTFPTTVSLLLILIYPFQQRYYRQHRSLIRQHYWSSCVWQDQKLYQVSKRDRSVLDTRYWYMYSLRNFQHVNPRIATKLLDIILSGILLKGRWILRG